MSDRRFTHAELWYRLPIGWAKLWHGVLAKLGR